jgi:hypothetical protein
MQRKRCCNYKQGLPFIFKGNTILYKDSIHSQHHTTKTNKESDCTRLLVFNSGIRFTSVSLLFSGRFALWQRVSCNSHVFDTRLDEDQSQSTCGGEDKSSSLCGEYETCGLDCRQSVTSQKELFVLLRGLCSISGLYLSAVNQLSDIIIRILTCKSYPYSLSFGRYVINSKIVIAQKFERGRCEP